MAPETGALVAGAGKLAEEQKVGGSSVVFQRVVRDSGGSWPMLTRSNYADWALLMQVMLEEIGRASCRERVYVLV